MPGFERFADKSIRTVTPEDIRDFPVKTCHQDLISFWEQVGEARFDVSGDGTIVSEESNRLLGPEGIGYILDNEDDFDTDYTSIGIPFFNSLDREHFCMDAEGRVIYPEHEPPYVLSVSLADFLEKLSADPNHFNDLVSDLNESDLTSASNG